MEIHCSYDTIPRVFSVSPASLSFNNDSLSLVTVSGNFYPVEDSMGLCIWWFGETDIHPTSIIGEIQSHQLTCSPPVIESNGSVPPAITRLTVQVWSESGQNEDYTYCQSWLNNPPKTWQSDDYVNVEFTNGDKGTIITLIYPNAIK